MLFKPFEHLIVGLFYGFHASQSLAIGFFNQRTYHITLMPGPNLIIHTCIDLFLIAVHDGLDRLTARGHGVNIDDFRVLPIYCAGNSARDRRGGHADIVYTGLCLFS